MPPARRLDRYLLRVCLPPFFFGIALFSGLAVVSSILPRLQWIVGTPVLRMLLWFTTMLPNVFVQTLPAALVLATLLGVGRLAAGHEIVAVQAGGVPFRRLVASLVMLGVLCAAAALGLNEWVVPSANRSAVNTYWQLASGTSGLFRLARQDRADRCVHAPLRGPEPQDQHPAGRSRRTLGGAALDRRLRRPGGVRGGGLAPVRLRGHRSRCGGCSPTRRPTRRRPSGIWFRPTTVRSRPNRACCSRLTSSWRISCSRFTRGGIDDSRLDPSLVGRS